MPKNLDFSYSRLWEEGSFSRTPIGIVNIFLGLLRERFSQDISGQRNNFNWKPSPDTDEDSDYKDTQIYIERSGSVYADVDTYSPAIVVKRAALQYNRLVFADRATTDPKTMATLDFGQATTGINITCYSTAEAECEILSNLVYEFFVRGRTIVEKYFELQICEPRFLSEVSILNETAPEPDRLYQAMVQINLVFDWNHSHVPLKPVLKEIEVVNLIKSDIAIENDVLGGILIT